MYELEETSYGVEVDLSGHMNMDEVESFCSEFDSTTAPLSTGWSVIADHRNLAALPDGADERFAQMMQRAMANNCGATAVVVDSAIAAMQQRRMRDEIGMEGQKIINVEEADDWVREARTWVQETDVVNDG